MELLLLQLHRTLVHLRVFGLRTESLSILQPEDPLIKGEWLGGLEVFDEYRNCYCNTILMMVLHL